MTLSDDFHFCRAFRGDQDIVSRQRHKHYLFSRLRLKPGMTVLDLGCGSGSAALELALFADVRVFGVDTDNTRVNYFLATSMLLLIILYSDFGSYT
jgi:sterol 24-C-methyltransferase